ncbi:Mitochondrial import inner membrane translocase subunit Tim17-A [Oleoguttula sp. CCFEE 5521]
MASLLFSVAHAVLEKRQTGNYTETKNWRDSCTKATCDLKYSYWGYLPSIAANSVFAALFGISLLGFLVQAAICRKRFWGFSFAMSAGSFLEVLGYIGRIVSFSNPFNENGFLIQIVCLTIAPAFYAAAIYFCLRSIVLTFGPANSRLPATWYPRIFIPCDVVSLLLQAGGGGWASIASHSGHSAAGGNHIMQAGLAFQVLTLLIFIILASDFTFKTYSRYMSLGSAVAFDQTHNDLRKSRKFQLFLCALCFATLCIFTRSVYRVAELSEGWTGRLIKTQSYFIGLEGAIVSAGVLALNMFHPGFCFGEGWDMEKAATGSGRREKKGRKWGFGGKGTKGGTEAERSGGSSDGEIFGEEREVREKV